MKKGCTMPTDFPPRREEFRELLRTRLTDDKFRHCESVARYAAALAPGLNVDVAAAVTAGLLHDLCRGYGAEKLLAEADRRGLEISPIARQRPVLLHAPLAAVECRDELGIDDPDVLDAIRWHTTGCPGLGRLGQLLYLADFAEPEREYPEAAHTRAVLDAQGFDAALIYAARMRLGFLDKKKVVTPISQAFYQWLVQGSA